MSGASDTDSFELTEHPADVGIEARARTREGVLEQSCLGLMEILTDRSRVRDLEEHSFELEDASEPVVLRRTLSEVVFLSSTHGVLFSSFEVNWPHGGPVRVVCRGERLDASRHELRVEVKAVTSAGLRFERRGDAWCSFVLVDV